MGSLRADTHLRLYYTKLHYNFMLQNTLSNVLDFINPLSRGIFPRLWWPWDQDLGD